MHFFVIPGRPVPKVRMTQRSKWTDRAKRSLKYQEYVAWCAREAKIPALNGDIELTVKVYLKSRGRADLDNLIKAVADGLQWANVIKNDWQILRYGPGTGIYLGYDEEKVVVELACSEESKEKGAET